jgi:hypothetical protein
MEPLSQSWHQTSQMRSVEQVAGWWTVFQTVQVEEYSPIFCRMMQWRVV